MQMDKFMCLSALQKHDCVSVLLGPSTETILVQAIILAGAMALFIR